MDNSGNVIVIGSTTSAAIGLTWGGVTSPWDSAQTLAPLIIGLVGLVLFMVYEAKWAENPLVGFIAFLTAITIQLNATTARCVVTLMHIQFDADSWGSFIHAGDRIAHQQWQSVPIHGRDGRLPRG